MHCTRIVMKDGRIFDGPIQLWRPQLGYLTLMDSFTDFPYQRSPEGSDNNEVLEESKLYFRDMISAITANERISISKFGDQDEIERARKELKFYKIEPDF